MNPNRDLVCIGDLMLENILEVPQFPQVKQTLVLDSEPFELGGTSFNLCWYLAQWGWHPRLVGTVGERQLTTIQSTLSKDGLSAEGLIPVPGESDILMVWVHAGQYVAVYLKSSLPPNIEAKLRDHCAGARRLVVTGSRHPRLRQAAAALAQEFAGELLAFSPSYPIFEYLRSDLEPILTKAQFVVVNENESAFTCKLLGFSTPGELALAMRGTLIVTLANKGVRIYQGNEMESLGSFSNSAEDVIGAGDAFFAGFLHSYLNQRSVREAMRFASLTAAQLVDSGQIRTRIAETMIREQITRLFPPS